MIVHGQFVSLRRLMPALIEEALTFDDVLLVPGHSEVLPRDVELTARLEGLVLDPVYTGKTMAGLIDLVRKGFFKPEDTVVFIHTGGMPALFAYRSAFEEAS